MHELSIAIAIVEAASEEAFRNGWKVRSVRLRLGPLAGVVKEALDAAFECARDGTAISGATLHVEETSVTCRCPRCQGVRPVLSIQEMRCADCGSPAGHIESGRELELYAMEIEE